MFQLPRAFTTQSSEKQNKKNNKHGVVGLSRVHDKATEIN